MENDTSDRITHGLAKNPDVIVKSQQRGEPDLDEEQRVRVLKEVCFLSVSIYVSLSYSYLSYYFIYS